MSDLSNAIKQICEEKGLEFDDVISTIESALAAAYRKDFGEKNQNIKVEFNPDTGKSKVCDVKTVVEDVPEEEVVEEDTKEEVENKKTKKKETKKEKEIKGEKEEEKIEKDNEKKEKGKEEEKVEIEKEEEERKFNPKTDIQISEAKKIKKTAKLDDEIKTKLEVPSEYGRMAAQTAKQVIIQRLREVERETIFNEFKEKEHEVVGGVVQRREGRVVLIDLGKTIGFLPSDEQIYGESYNPGERIKVYIKEIKMGSKGASITLSRTSNEILKKVFYLEIPEISNGLIELKSVAREAGSRAKVAVWTDSENVDPIGACVGQRGARIQTIITELGGEKIDIIEYDDDIATYISNALSPAKVLGIDINEETKEATVNVAEDQLSLAIGKNGQNARLAARLTDWRINIVGKDAKDGDSSKDKNTKEDKEDVKEEEKKNEKKKEEEKKEKKDDKKEVKKIEKKDEKKKEDKEAK